VVVKRIGEASNNGGKEIWIEVKILGNIREDL
jgi:hypothetical protein